MELDLASTILIERLVPGGAGLARLDSGEVILVPGALPGDHVSIGKGQRRGGAWFADEFVVQRASNERVLSPCVFSTVCGGCDLIELGAEAQRAAKLDILHQAFKRTAGITLAEGTIQWIPSPKTLAYRERIRLQVADGQLGLFARSSHELANISHCEVALPILNDALRCLRQVVEDERAILSAFSSIEIRVVGSSTVGRLPTLLVHLVTKQSIERTTRFAQPRRSKRARSTGKKRRVDSEGTSAGVVKQHISSALHASCLGYVIQVRVDKEAVEPSADTISGQSFSYFRPGSFSQVNPEINRRMIDIVTATAQQTSARNFLDLYCGSGNFAIPLLALGLHGTGVEVDSEAIELARRATHEQTNQSWGLGTFVVAKSHNFGQHQMARHRYDLVIVDPPRAGAKEVLDLVTRVCDKTLIMVSCDPVTLARDLRVLLASDFSLESVLALDMFPQTHHVETMAILSKTER